MHTKLPFATKQKMATFKRLQRRMRAEKTIEHLQKLTELDAYLAQNVPNWKPTYALHL